MHNYVTYCNISISISSTGSVNQVCTDSDNISILIQTIQSLSHLAGDIDT